MSYGERVKNARQYLRMSQQELANKVGTSQQIIQQIETGRTKRANLVPEISKILGMDPTWLAFGEGKSPLNPLDKSIKIPKGHIPLLQQVDIMKWITPGNKSLIKSMNSIGTPNNEPIDYNLFGYKIENDVMYDQKRVFKEGNVVIIHPTFDYQKIKSGDYIMCKLEDESLPTIRQLIVDGKKSYLKALNLDYSRQELTQEVLYIGVVVEVRIPVLKRV